MRSLRQPFLVFLTAGVLLGSAFPAAWAQAPSGSLAIATDYELFGTLELAGGGHVTWTLSGEQARLLRMKILGLFDGYPQIPHGFPYYSAATSSIPNGRIDAGEALAYTSFLETELEGESRNEVGTRIGYFLLDRADLFERAIQGGLERSTSGLLGSDANTTSDLQIRFLFNGYARDPDVPMTLPTRAYADALHSVFRFHQEQAPNLDATTPGHPARPFQTEAPWHVVTGARGLPALWAGNDTTGRYDNDTLAVTRTYSDPTLFIVPMDLKYASNATASFAYAGHGADANDTLRFEIATGPTFADWTPLLYQGRAALPATPSDDWVNLSFDLSAYVGEEVRFRLVFESDGAGNDAPGFYVRGFAVDAPSTFEGTIHASDAHYVIGLLSFSDIQAGAGAFQLVRTPGGEILLYTATWDADAPPADTVRYQALNGIENPQILFVIMLSAAYFISRSQEAAYARYKEAHPGPYRPAVRKLSWLHTLGKVAIAVLVLFYFVPTALYFVGLRLFVSGPVYVFLALTLALGLGLVSRAYYQQKLEEAPPPATPEDLAAAHAGGGSVPVAPLVAEPLAHCTHCLREIPASDRAYRCTCGSVYHLACASGLMRCSNCRKPIAVEVVRKKISVSMRCEACGEVQAVDEGVDPRTVTCTACGGRLRHLDEGKGYLLVASNPAIAFGWLRDLSKGGKSALVLTPSSPDRLRLEFGLKGVDVLQMSSTAEKGLDPKRLDPVALRAILPLLKKGRGGVLVYDGLEEVIATASLGDVVRFIRKANDMAFVNGVTVLGRVAPGALTPDESKRLSAEFDETLDLAARF